MFTAQAQDVHKFKYSLPGATYWHAVLLLTHTFPPAVILLQDSFLLVVLGCLAGVLLVTGWGITGSVRFLF